MSAPVPVVAVRGSTGISLNYGPPGYDPITAFAREDSKTCKAMFFSPDGKYFAWINGTVVKIALTSTWKVHNEFPRPKVSNATFSPLGTYLITWEPYVVNQASPQGGPNLHFYKADTGELVRAFVHKNQLGWDPQWSSDESLCARLLNNDVLFYEDHSFETSVNKCSPAKVAGFSLAPGPAPHHVICYLPGQSGQPCFVKLFQYPNFEITQAKASKSFFQADRVDMYWNSKGTGVLAMTSSDVDKSGASYYGKQTLHYVSTKGETFMVTLGAGSVYSVQWNPKGNEFCAVYGVMPAKATLFNLKCEPVHHFGVGPRNSIYYNPFGNLLILGGFGNLRGGIEMYDVNQRKLIAKFDAPETTQLQWSPDGEHFFTATCAPRLRQGNGFKLWHYSGKELYDRPWNKQEELWEVTWQAFPSDTFKEPAIRFKPSEILQNTTTTTKAPYRPPSARAKAEEAVPSAPEPAHSKAALKMKKKREAKKAKKEEEGQGGENHSTSNQISNGLNVLPEGDMPDDPEKQKKIKKLKSKLVEIGKLKEQVDAGKKLEINQLDKIKKEAELFEELKELYL